MQTPPELSHPVRIDGIGGAAITVSLRPDQAVRAALAARFDLLSVDTFEAALMVRRRRQGGWIEVSGTLTASVTQSCVVTTDPVPASVTAEIEELFDDSGETRAEEIDLDFTSDTPEPVDGDSIDVGEIAAQAFGLALDPYPRAPGAEPEMTAVGPDGESGASPFTKLEALKRLDVTKG